MKLVLYVFCLHYSTIGCGLESLEEQQGSGNNENIREKLIVSLRFYMYIPSPHPALVSSSSPNSPPVSLCFLSDQSLLPTFAAGNVG